MSKKSSFIKVHICYVSSRSTGRFACAVTSTLAASWSSWWTSWTSPWTGPTTPSGGLERTCGWTKRGEFLWSWLVIKLKTAFVVFLKSLDTSISFKNNYNYKLGAVIKKSVFLPFLKSPTSGQNHNRTELILTRNCIQLNPNPVQRRAKNSEIILLPFWKTLTLVPENFQRR